jgi:hypothetical protein
MKSIRDNVRVHPVLGEDGSVSEVAQQTTRMSDVRWLCLAPHATTLVWNPTDGLSKYIHS